MILVSLSEIDPDLIKQSSKAMQVVGYIMRGGHKLDDVSFDEWWKEMHSISPNPTTVVMDEMGLNPKIFSPGPSLELVIEESHRKGWDQWNQEAKDGKFN